MMLFSEARNRTCFWRKAGAAKSDGVQERWKKGRRKPLTSPRVMEEDPAKPGSGTKRAEPKPRKKIKESSHVQMIIK